MKRTRIRHLGDKSMFYGESGWSLNPENARNFTTPLQAIAFVIQNKISNTEVVIEGKPKEQLAVAVQAVHEVRVVIQDKKSFRYLRSESDWTNNVSNARNFQRVREAAEFCRQNNLHHSYIVTGDFDAKAGEFNGAIKSRLDVAQLRSSIDRGEQAPLEPQMNKPQRV